MQKTIISILISLLCSLSISSQEEALSGQEEAHKFFYNHTENLQYNIISEVRERVRNDIDIDYRTFFLNKIAVKVRSTDGSQANLDVNYTISEQSEDNYFSWSKDIYSNFDMRSDGSYLVRDPLAISPSLRNVPSFPRQAIKPGYAWSRPAVEIYDLEILTGIPGQIKTEFEANYIYRGTANLDGERYQHILIVYSIDKSLKEQLRKFKQKYPAKVLPTQIKTSHSIDLYWDLALGLPVYEKEYFNIRYELDNGRHISFVGTANGRLSISKKMEKEKIKEDIEKRIKDADIAANVEINELGVKLSFDTIYFQPNSEIMRPGQDAKIKKIADILEVYGDRDVLITGHTANVGDPLEQLELSKKRAGTIANYLLENNIRNRDHIIIQGKGGNEPVASNRTSRGREKNRRVDITLIEN